MTIEIILLFGINIIFLKYIIFETHPMKGVDTCQTGVCDLGRPGHDRGKKPREGTWERREGTWGGGNVNRRK